MRRGVSNLDIEVAGICRDDACSRLEVHPIHPVPRRADYDGGDGVWVGGRGYVRVPCSACKAFVRVLPNGRTVTHTPGLAGVNGRLGPSSAHCPGSARQVRTSHPNDNSSALAPCVWSAVTAYECRTATQIHTAVVHDFGQVHLRNVQRVLHAMVLQRNAALITSTKVHIGQVPQYHGMCAYLRANSPLLGPGGFVDTLREQLHDLVVTTGKRAKPLPSAVPSWIEPGWRAGDVIAPIAGTP